MRDRRKADSRWTFPTHPTKSCLVQSWRTLGYIEILHQAVEHFSRTTSALLPVLFDCSNLDWVPTSSLEISGRQSRRKYSRSRVPSQFIFTERQVESSGRSHEERSLAFAARGSFRFDCNGQSWQFEHKPQFCHLKVGQFGQLLQTCFRDSIQNILSGLRAC